MAGFAIADAGIASQGDDALLVHGDDGRSDGQLAPHDLALASALGDVDFVVRGGEGGYQWLLLAGRESGIARELCLDGCYWCFGEMDLGAKEHLNRATSGESEGGKKSKKKRIA
jgi:hypothetical protein